MKKFILPLALVALTCTQAQAQTKRIAHRSHSGTDRTFRLNGSDNFGNPPEDWKNIKEKPMPVTDTAKAGTQGLKQVESNKKKQSKKAARRQKKQASRGPQ